VVTGGSYRVLGSPYSTQKVPTGHWEDTVEPARAPIATQGTPIGTHGDPIAP